MDEDGVFTLTAEEQDVRQYTEDGQDGQKKAKLERVIRFVAFPEFEALAAGRDYFRVTFERGKNITLCEIAILTVDKDLDTSPELDQESIDDNCIWTLLAFGLGVRKHADQYDAAYGCEMALRSAIRRYGPQLDNDVRTAIWQEFHKVFPYGQRKAPANESEKGVPPPMFPLAGLAAVQGLVRAIKRMDAQNKSRRKTRVDELVSMIKEARKRSKVS